ncbi:MAG: hypothetical protein H6626_10275 [Pseudobdellovibrionaceae bacterium]|nr:MAG: hypothetical protein H6626_10275 [Pseudobdellovibrionaceae bacterium]
MNTSNPNKLREFERYLGAVESTLNDLPEPDADPLTVIRYKASQFSDVLVDDTILDIAGEDIGVKVRWKLNELDRYIGQSARFICLLGVLRGEHVYIFKGELSGSIVPARGKSFGFLPYFLPNGVKQTLAENLPDELNPRYFAVKALLENRPWRVCAPLPLWSGPFQQKLKS